MLQLCSAVVQADAACAADQCMQSPSRLQMAGAGDSQGPDSDTEKWQGNISYKMHQFRAQHEINQQPSPVTTCTQVDWTQARNEPAWSFLEREGLHFLTFFSRQNLQVWSTVHSSELFYYLLLPPSDFAQLVCRRLVSAVSSLCIMTRCTRPRQESACHWLEVANFSLRPVRKIWGQLLVFWGLLQALGVREAF